MTGSPASPPSGRGPAALPAMLAIALGWAMVRFVAGRTARPGTTEGRAPRPEARNRLGPAPDPAAPQHAHPAAAATEPGRGRRADSPGGIPARGWKDVLWRVYEEFGQDRVMSVAAGVTYYALLALFPALGALVSVYGLFADPLTIQDHLAALSGILPGGAIDIVGEQVKRIAAKGDATLGTSFAVGLAVSLWSANAGMKAVFDALNIAYDEEEKRGFLHLNLLSLAFTLGAIAFVLLALAAIVVLPLALDFVGLGGMAEFLIAAVRWPVLLAVVVGGLALLYRHGPSRDKAKWRWVTPGGIVAAVLWLAASMLFSWYVANFGSYDETYGSLGAVIGAMTWIWVSSIVVLLGGEVNAEMEHQTANDTTVGPDRPMGQRGATMADTLGPAKA